VTADKTGSIEGKTLISGTSTGTNIPPSKELILFVYD